MTFKDEKYNPLSLQAKGLGDLKREKKIKSASNISVTTKSKIVVQQCFEATQGKKGEAADFLI